MADVHIHAEEYNGHDLTVQLRLNTGTGDFGNGTENTHTIYAAVDTLSVLNLTAGSTSPTITHASLAGKYVSAITIAAAPKIYSQYDPATDETTFSRAIASTTLTLQDGSTFTNLDAVDVYYLPDGSGDATTGIRKRDVGDAVSNAIEHLKTLVDTPTDADIASIMRGLGYARNT
jgi:hypothetical protein